MFLVGFDEVLGTVGLCGDPLGPLFPGPGRGLQGLGQYGLVLVQLTAELLDDIVPLLDLPLKVPDLLVLVPDQDLEFLETAHLHIVVILVVNHMDGRSENPAGKLVILQHAGGEASLVEISIFVCFHTHQKYTTCIK